MHIPGYIFPCSEMSVNLTFIDFNDINYNESGLARHLQKILLSFYMKIKAPKYLCKSDPFVLRNTWNHSEGQWDLDSELPVT